VATRVTRDHEATGRGPQVLQRRARSPVVAGEQPQGSRQRIDQALRIGTRRVGKLGSDRRRVETNGTRQIAGLPG
jgi:hypothetical protein